MEKRDIMAGREKLSAGERDTHTAVDTPLSQRETCWDKLAEMYPPH